MFWLVEVLRAGGGAETPRRVDPQRKILNYPRPTEAIPAMANFVRAMGTICCVSRSIHSPNIISFVENLPHKLYRQSERRFENDDWLDGRQIHGLHDP